VGCTCLENFDVFSRKEPMKIKDFSMGYRDNGLVLTASKKDLAIAQQGLEKKIKRPVMSLENGATALDNGDDQKPAAKKRKPLSESKISNQSENQPVTTKKKASAASTKKAASKTTKKSAATVKKPKKVTVTKPKKSIPKELKSVSSEKSTDIVVAPTTRRSTRVRSAPKSLY
jgi:cell division septation protein DedD